MKRIWWIGIVAAALLALTKLASCAPDLVRAPAQVRPTVTATPRGRAFVEATPLLGVARRTSFVAAGASVTPVLRPTSASGLVLDVHVEANASGEGSAHVVASSQGGQALAHIDTKGKASGLAVANAPALPSCNACGGVEPLDAVSVTPAAIGSVAAATGQAMITGDGVNLRAGPGLGYAVLGAARLGDMLPITGRSADQAWWRVCCVGTLNVWVNGSYVTQASDVASPAPMVASPTVTVTPAPSVTPAWPFVIDTMEQHSEANSAVVYGWVHDVAGVSLENYSLRITKNGQVVDFGELSRAAGGTVATTGYRQGTTRPSAAGGPEDKPYNFKLAFDPHVVGGDFDPVGTWTVQLLDAQGLPAGPVALFALRPQDARMEMYVSYVRK